MLKNYVECSEFIRELLELCTEEQFIFPCIAEYLLAMDDEAFMKLIHPRVINGNGESFCSILQQFRSARKEILLCVS